MIPLLSVPADPPAVAAPDARPAGPRAQSESDAEPLRAPRPRGSAQTPSNPAGGGEGDFVGILLALAGEASRTTEAGAVGERSEAGIVQEPLAAPAQPSQADGSITSPGPSTPLRTGPSTPLRTGPSIPRRPRDWGQVGGVEQQDANQTSGQALALEALSGVPASALADPARVPAEEATGAAGLAGQPAAHAGASVPTSSVTTPRPSSEAVLAEAAESGRGEVKRARVPISLPEGQDRVTDSATHTPGRGSPEGESQGAVGTRRTEVPRNEPALGVRTVQGFSRIRFSSPPPANAEMSTGKVAPANETIEVAPASPQVVRASRGPLPAAASPDPSAHIRVDAGGRVRQQVGSAAPGNRVPGAPSADPILPQPATNSGEAIAQASQPWSAQTSAGPGEVTEGLGRVASSIDAILPLFVRAIRQAAAQGDMEVPLRLHPETLGEILVGIGEEGDLRTLQLATATPAAQASLERTLPALRAALQEEGVHLERIQVRIRPEGSAGGETPALGRAMGASASSCLAPGNGNGTEGEEPGRVASESMRRAPDDRSVPRGNLALREREPVPLSTDNVEANAGEGAPAPVATAGDLPLPRPATSSGEASGGHTRVAPSAEPLLPLFVRALRQAALAPGAPVRLQAENVGEIQVQVQAEGDLRPLQLATATPAAQVSLERTLPALQAALQEEGVTLDRLEVGVRPDVGPRTEIPAGARVAVDATPGATGHTEQPTAKGAAGVSPFGEAMPRPSSQAFLATAEGSAHRKEERAGTSIRRSEAQGVPADVDPPAPGQESQGDEAQSAVAGTQRTEAPRNEPAVGVSPKSLTAKAPRTPTQTSSLEQTTETPEGPMMVGLGSSVERSEDRILGDPGTQRSGWVIMTVQGASPEVSTGKVAPATETIEVAQASPQIVRANRAPLPAAARPDPSAHIRADAGGRVRQQAESAAPSNRVPGAPSAEPLIPQIVRASQPWSAQTSASPGEVTEGLGRLASSTNAILPLFVRALRQAALAPGAPIRLQVENVGEIQVQVQAEGDLRPLQLATATPAAQASLERTLPALQAALQEEGVTLDRLEVGVRPEWSAGGETPALGRAMGATASSWLASASGNGGGAAEWVGDGPVRSAPPVDPSGRPRSGEPGGGAPAPMVPEGSGRAIESAADGSESDPEGGNGGAATGRRGTRLIEPASQRRVEAGEGVAQAGRVTAEVLTLPPRLDPALGPPGAPATMRQIARAIRQAAAQGGMEVRLRLHPESLGEVRVQVRWEGGLVTARLEAATPAAHELLERGLPTLRTALQEQGVPLDRLQVGLRLDVGAQSQNPDLGRPTGGPLAPPPVPAGVAPETAEVIAAPIGRLDIRI